MDDDPIRVLVVEDHRMFAEALERALARCGDITVVATVASAAEARRATRATRPDVVLVDQYLPDGRGTDTARALRAELPATRVVLISGRHDDALAREAAAAGCSGFVLKTQSIDELARALRTAADGEVVVPRGVPHELAILINRAVRQNRLGLTSRELEVLQEIAAGASTRAVAARLCLSLHTVRNHVQSIIRKCGAHSKLEAVAVALAEGVIRTPVRSMPA